MDPYVVLTCRSQEQKSSVSTGWFMFNIILKSLPSPILKNLEVFLPSELFIDCIQERGPSLNGMRLLYSPYLMALKRSP